ncbi:hypothetical protein SAMN02910447_00565 [Ruminococcus sp. YE71]|uniref:hypothetical protein n=1 Tax=unclassified Ruminococcus TaxID=2608920 RepID=UPI00088851AB|nr:MULTISPECIES: hypothetical protein [unclassified Ruminococcus]SDA12260.1 hypothetical protein SAMN02910446_00564 [Ruminococcus sp. YE78]SFW16649.1 hypothetical protein SAMN02910447_00565 [Ruminococcus sp. YE71]
MADESKRCVICENIPLVTIHNPQEYFLCLDSFIRMVMHNDLEIVYQTCPLDKVYVDGKWYKRKIFHQFKCPACGSIYGMYCDVAEGGEIKMNDKVFIPEEYKNVSADT